MASFSLIFFHPADSLIFLDLTLSKGLIACAILGLEQRGPAAAFPWKWLTRLSTTYHPRYHSQSSAQPERAAKGTQMTFS